MSLFERQSQQGYWKSTDIRLFSSVLMGAYKYDSLKRVIREALDKNLEHLVKSSSFDDVVFELIERAEREGWILELIDAVYAGNPDNQPLATFAQDTQNRIKTQTQLVKWLNASTLSLDDLQAIYHYFADQIDFKQRPKSDTRQKLVADLWSVPVESGGHQMLVRVMRVVASRAPAPIRIQIEQWLANNLNTLTLPEREFFAKSADLIPPSTLFVIIEEQGNGYLFGVWTTQDGEQPSAEEQKSATSLADLRNQLSEDMDWEMAESSSTLVEVYLPKSLASLDVDTWTVDEDELPFALRSSVQIGLTERQRAIALERELIGYGNDKRKKRLRWNELKKSKSILPRIYRHRE